MALGWRNYWDKVKRYYPYNKEEKKALLITALVLTFIIAFNDGNKEFMLSRWLIHFIIMLIGVSISVLFHETGHRLIAFTAGFRVEYQLWWYGLVIGVILTIITKGHAWIIIPGSIWAHHMVIHRLGFFRYGPNILSSSLIALSGPVASIVLATWIKTMDWMLFATSNPLLHKLFLFNLAYAIWSLVPIPPLDGSKVFFHSRLTFAFVFGCVLAYVIMAAFGFYSWIVSLIIGGVIWLLFYIFFERTQWTGW